MTSQLTAKVANEELWSKFHECCNEMIVIKSGRKLFPRVGFEVHGVEPKAQYSLALSIVRLDDNRYKFEDGKWIVAGHVHSDDPTVQSRVIQHHDGALLGAHLLKGPVYFDQLALTNDRDGGVGSKIFVQTLCKYRPLLSICRIEEEPTTSSNEQKLIFSDAVMEFIAVTQYQNIHIVELKNQFNPYAKGQRFRRNGKIYQSRKRTSDDSNDSFSPKPKKFLECTKSCSAQSDVFPMLSQHPDLMAGVRASAFINPLFGCFSPPPFWSYPFWNAASPLCSLVNPFSSSNTFAYLTPTCNSNTATIQEI